jgi:energy-coupling factor transporter ATP-binding protein EcfA2
MKYLTREVFTPSAPAKACFIERDSINRRLVNALQTAGKQLVIYGHSGSGKTTILQNKLFQLYENHITTRCMAGMTFEQVLLDAFDQLAPYYIAESSHSSKSNISASIQATYLGIKSTIGSHLESMTAEKFERFLPPQLTAQNLSKFIGESKCCWVLEDFHKVNENEKERLSQVMKVFMDQAAEYPDLKIIAIGAVDTARQVVDYDPEMKNRVSEILVPLMTDLELQQILDKGQSLLNINFDSALADSVVKYSSGVASTCHAIALSCCEVENIDDTQSATYYIDKGILEKALRLYIEDSADTLKSAFDRAFSSLKKTKFDNYKIITEALTHFDQEGAEKSDILSQIENNHRGYPATNLGYCLGELQTRARGNLLRFDSESRKYSFSDPVFRAYALALFKDYDFTKPEEQLTLHLAGPDVIMKSLSNEIIKVLSKIQSDRHNQSR